MKRFLVKIKINICQFFIDLMLLKLCPYCENKNWFKLGSIFYKIAGWFIKLEK
jgi:hypothetical protein